MIHYRRPNPNPPTITLPRNPGSWSARYGERHRLHRITEYPGGVAAPKKVRIYARNGHFIVQWWDPAAKRNLCEKVVGDLIDALAAARDVDRRLADFKKSGRVSRRLKHADLVNRFVSDLRARADAGEIATATVQRYRSALAHYLAFTETAEIQRLYRYTVGVDRQFALAFAAFLESLRISPNGRAGSPKKPMRAKTFVLNAIRAMFEWAGDPDRGNSFPAGFRNPFRRAGLQRRKALIDPTGEPDITMTMAVDFMASCDHYQLRLFGPMCLYGLRASEPAFLLQERIEDGWVKVGCIPGLSYITKGMRDKRLPLLDVVAALWRVSHLDRQTGLVYVRRKVAADRQSYTLAGASLQELIDEFDRRCGGSKVTSAIGRQRIRDDLIRDAGGLTYEQINNEFHRVAKPLGWPSAATLKDFRHLFATSLANGGLQEHERRYLMGHAPGRDAIHIYTHLNELAEHFRTAAESQWSDMLRVIRTKVGMMDHFETSE